MDTNKELITGIYNLCTVLLITVPFMWMSVNEMEKDGKRRNILRLLGLFFIVYCFFLLNRSGAGTIWNYKAHGIYKDMMDTAGTQWISDFLFKVLIFIPMGILLPLISGEEKNLMYTIGWSGVFSLMIEISQLFNFYHSSIVDVLLSMVGAFIGALIWRVFTDSTRDAFGIQHVRIDRVYTVAVFIIAYLSRFILFNRNAILNLLNI